MTGDDLRKFRLSLKLSQTEFGLELGFKNPQTQISKFEHGERPISLRVERAVLMWKENIRLIAKSKRTNHVIEQSATSL